MVMAVKRADPAAINSLVCNGLFFIELVRKQPLSYLHTFLNVVGWLKLFNVTSFG